MKQRSGREQGNETREKETIVARVEKERATKRVKERTVVGKEKEYIAEEKDRRIDRCRAHTCRK